MSTEQTPSTPTKITTSLEEEEVEDKAIADAVTASPLHMHVALGAVLPGKPLPSHNLSSRSSSRSRTSLRSHSRSPSPQQQQQQQQVQVPSSTASSTSMEFLDEDILTDKMGMLELESQPCHVKPLLEQQGKKLPSVNERMSEESLDDVHAFSDLRNVIRQIKNHNSNNNNNNNNGSGNSLEKESGNSGTISSASSDGARSIGGSSYVDQGHLLETLLEFEEDDEEEEDTTDDDDDDNNDNKNEGETLKKKLKKKKEKSFKSHCDDKLEAKE